MNVATALAKISKRGNEFVGSDDAWWRGTNSVVPFVPMQHYRFAVSDGASGSIYSGLWARLLTRAYAAERLSDDIVEWPWEELSTAWRRLVERRLKAKHGQEVPWYLTDKLSTPAQAAILGLTLFGESRDVLQWHACAVGDACLAHVTSAGLRETFPMTDAKSFGNDPVLATADPVARSHPPAMGWRVGPFHQGDRLYLMTDAIAAWFMGREVDSCPWSTLDMLLDADDGMAFERWANEEREAGRLKNDDVTVLRISLSLD